MAKIKFYSMNNLPIHGWVIPRQLNSFHGKGVRSGRWQPSVEDCDAAYYAGTTTRQCSQTCTKSVTAQSSAYSEPLHYGKDTTILERRDTEAMERRDVLSRYNAEWFNSGMPRS